MDPDPRFDFGDREGAAAYRWHMLSWRDRSRSPIHQLTDKSTFAISLQAPTLPFCANSSTRPLPALPFGITAHYALVKPLQTGVQYSSEVWLAVPSELQDSHFNSPAAAVVFKFIVPSIRGDIPTSDLDDEGFIDGRKFVFPFDAVKGEAACYESLADFQGSTVPYFYGIHRVLMPSGEPAWILALEWIPGSPGSLYVLNKELRQGGDTKYSNYGPFMRLFHSALSTLQSAHARNVNHADVRAANILIDAVHNQAVLIDWTSDQSFSPNTRSALPVIDLRKLHYAFVAAWIEPQSSEIRRICRALDPKYTSDDS
ncbi:hypothetical protein K466DRAFT_661100 [Polyporus arcularius HHB13444]|uniref:Non-specific serine/threonine protein kinase n=1 Tax=Polyporus arcularius HHB13444 TaxID=1314778 RepID=A0A5C3PL74_9APHY|nr:hypothetical protein K466DRAFT_661100 [Polyporus arcularius HHB13444]